MGRHRRKVTRDGDQDNDDPEFQEKIEERLGHRDKVCLNCDIKNDSGAEKCRKCGHTRLRRKASEFRGKGTDGSNL